MHSRAEDPQTAFSTKRVIARKHDCRVSADQARDNQSGQQLPDMVDVPRGLREEPVVIREVSISNRIAGDDQVGDIAMPGRENPTSHQQTALSEKDQ